MVNHHQSICFRIVDAAVEVRRKKALSFGRYMVGTECSMLIHSFVSSLLLLHSKTKQRFEALFLNIKILIISSIMVGTKKAGLTCNNDVMFWR